MRSAGARRRAFWWGRAAATFARRENRAGAPRKSARQIARGHPILFFPLWAFGSPTLSFFFGGGGRWARRRIWSCVPENAKSNRINARTPEVHLGGGLPRKAPPSNEALRLKKKKNMAAGGAGGAALARAPRTRAAPPHAGPRATNPQARQGQPQTDARTSQPTASQRRPLSGGRSPPFDRPPGHATPHGQPAARESMTWANLPASPTSRSERAHRRDVIMRRPAGAGLAVGRWWPREAGCGTRRQLGRSAVCTSPHVLRDINQPQPTNQPTPAAPRTCCTAPNVVAPVGSSALRSGCMTSASLPLDSSHAGLFVCRRKGEKKKNSEVDR